jgi:hypothetical protein
MPMEERVKDQFSGLFITLVSVLVGLVFADLISQAETRMALWPLNASTLRTWAQIATMGSNAFGVWVYYTHFGVPRRRVPSLIDSVIAFAIPIPLLIANSLVGRPELWPWLYFASGYLVICLLTVLWLVHTLKADHPSFARLGRASGNLAVFYLGAPAFFAMGLMDQHGWFSPWMEVFAVFGAVPTALIAVYIYLRDWRLSIAEASK